jgi:hypothetical protein
MSSVDSPDVKGKTTGPGIVLIVTAILNVLTSIGLLVSGFGMTAAANNPEFNREFKKGMDEGLKKNTQMNAEERKQAEAMAKGIQEGIGNYGMACIVSGVLGLVCSLVIGLGGGMMMGMRSYGLSMAASVLAILPCSSPCCLIGAIGGIWGIVVMMNPDVKAAFR